MATLTYSYKPHTLRFAIVQKRDDLIEKMMPRRCMVVSVGMIFAGLGIPALMVFNLLPISLVLAFVGLALAAVGGVLALVFCGEL